MSVFLTVLLSLRSTVTRQLSWISPWLGRGLPVRIIWKVSDRAARIRAPLQQAEQTYSTHGVINLKLEELGNRISYEYRLISRMLWLARQIHARPFYKYFQREQLSGEQLQQSWREYQHPWLVFLRYPFAISVRQNVIHVRCYDCLA